MFLLDATAELEHMQKLRNIVKGGATGKESGNSYLQRSLSKASERFDELFSSCLLKFLHNSDTITYHLIAQDLVRKLSYFWTCFDHIVILKVP